MTLLQLHRDLGLFSYPFLLRLDLAGEFLNYFAAGGLLPAVVLFLVVDNVLVLSLSVLQGNQVIREELVVVGTGPAG